MNFKGKTAVITGASVGIGRAVALLLAEGGANLVLTDINYEGLEKVKEEAEKFGVEALIYKCDVSDEKTVNSVVQEAINHFGKTDILVNSVCPGSVSSSEDPDIDSFQESTLAYMGRTGTDRENANLICFLASDDSGYISGQTIQIDGCRRKL